MSHERKGIDVFAPRLERGSQRRARWEDGDA